MSTIEKAVEKATSNWYIPWLVTTILACLALFSSVYFFVRIERETAERRDQICSSFERDQAQDVERLESTYRFLAGLPVRERTDSLTLAVITGLGDTERDAREDDAPKFCDEPGVGLREPDPVAKTKRPGWLEKKDKRQHGESKYQNP